MLPRYILLPFSCAHIEIQAKRAKPGLVTKTSIMLGVGETDEEVFKALHGIAMSCWGVGGWGVGGGSCNMQLYDRHHIHFTIVN